MREFKQSFHQIEDQVHLSEQKLTTIQNSLKVYYETEFLPRLNPNLENKKALLDFWPEERKTQILQYSFLSHNSYPVNSKDKLEWDSLCRDYSNIHKKYHHIIRNFVKTFGYYDIFLIDDKTGHIVYSVFKEIDFGTSLSTGPFKETNLAQVFRANADRPNKKATMVDFEHYEASYTAPAAFIGTPIFDTNNKQIGVLAFQIPINEIDKIMTGDKNWEENGLGQTGETYIVGADYKMRSTSRFLAENPDHFFYNLEQTGLRKKSIDRIKTFNTTILQLEDSHTPIDQVMDGKTGTGFFNDYRAIQSLVAYAPLKVDHVDWAIISKIDQREAFEPIKYLIIESAIEIIVILLLSIGCFIIIDKMMERLYSQWKKTQESEAEVKRMSQVKIDFLAKMSHELRTPLNGILGMCYLMLENPMSEEQKTLLNNAKKSAEFLKSLIDEVLDFAKIDSDEFTTRTGPCRIRNILSDVRQSLSTELKHKELSLLENFDTKIPDILYSDPLRLHQIFLNIITNAIKYTTNGFITVIAGVLEESDDSIIIRFEISDTGKGIPEAIQKQLFDPFFQIDHDAHTKHQGVGLGLAIVKKLILHLNGNIGLNSKAGYGSTFWLEIPFKKKSDQTPENPEDYQTNFNPEATSLNILIAEDNPVNITYLTKILENKGHQAVCVQNGNEVLDEFEKGYDLIIMDCLMPEMDGYTATKTIRVRERKTHTHIPIIALTANVTESEKEKCLDSGMDLYLTKPFTPQQIHDAISKIFSNRLFEQSAIGNSPGTTKTFKLNLDQLNQYLTYSELTLAELIDLAENSRIEAVSRIEEAILKNDTSKINKVLHKTLSLTGITGDESFHSFIETNRTQLKQTEIIPEDFVIHFKAEFQKLIDELKNLKNNTSEAQ